MAYPAILRKLPSALLNANLEDVLTATVFGAIAYGPPALTRSFFTEVVGLPAPVRTTFDFWPEHRTTSGRIAEPDVFLSLGRPAAGALVVEAKQGSEPYGEQLADEADAARATFPDLGPLHLLTVSDTAVAPSALAPIASPAGPYASARHRSWADLYLFLEGWTERSELDAGSRRLVADALAVLRKFNREPFKGMSLSEVERMASEIPAMYALPSELRKLHVRLERTLRALPTPLYLNDNERKVSIDIGRAFDRPETWLARCITLPYGPESGKRHSRYYFVRVLLEHPGLWIGYSTPRHELSPAVKEAGRASAVAKVLRREGIRVASVSEQMQPLTVLRDPTDVSKAVLAEIIGTSAPRVDLVVDYPLTRLSEAHAADLIEADLLRIIRVCRASAGLGAP